MGKKSKKYFILKHNMEVPNEEFNFTNKRHEETRESLQTRKP